MQTEKKEIEEKLDSLLLEKSTEMFYLGWTPALIREVNELTRRWEMGEDEDVQPLVKRYQDGEHELLPRIKKGLHGVIHTAQRNLNFNKDNKTIYISGLYLKFEPINFQREDINRLADSCLHKALISYNNTRRAAFTTWFYTNFYGGLIDLYRKYRVEWSKGRVIDEWEEYEDKINNSIIPGIEYSVINDETDIQPDILVNLNTNEKRWIALYLKMLPARLSKNLTARALGVSIKTEFNIREGLKEKLQGYVDSLSIGPRRQYKDSSNHIEIRNEYGVKDPTAHEALNNLVVINGIITEKNE